MLLKSNVVAKHFAISVPLHDLSHYFWSVLLQAFFFTDNLTLPSRVDRSSPTTTLLLSIFRNLCPATTTLSFSTAQTWRWLFFWSCDHNPEQAASTNNLPRPILPVNTSVEPTTHRSRTHYMIRNLPNKLHIVTLRGQQLQLSATL